MSSCIRALLSCLSVGLQRELLDGVFECIPSLSSSFVHEPHELGAGPVGLRMGRQDDGVPSLERDHDVVDRGCARDSSPGVMAATTPTGFAISVMPVSGSSRSAPRRSARRGGRATCPSFCDGSSGSCRRRCPAPSRGRRALRAAPRNERPTQATAVTMSSTCAWLERLERFLRLRGRGRRRRTHSSDRLVDQHRYAHANSGEQRHDDARLGHVADRKVSGRVGGRRSSGFRSRG